MARRAKADSGSFIDGGMLMWGVIIVVGFFIWRSNPQILDQFKGFVDGFLKGLKSTTTTPATAPSDDSSTPAGTSTSSAPTTAGGTGELIYKGTGKVSQATASGFKTRHYASGKPDDITQEWNVESCPYEEYEMTIGVNIGAPDHDDTVSMKMLGPHHTDGIGAWHIVDIGFMNGDFSLGHEKPHPTTKSGEVKGKSIGSIVSKDVELKGVIYKIASGHHIEGWAKVSGTWQKMVEGDNVGGVFQRDPAQQVQFRIDAAPHVVVKYATVTEITAPTAGSTPATGTTPTTPATPAAASLATLTSPWTKSHECGLLCEEILGLQASYAGAMKQQDVSMRYAFLPSDIKVRLKL